MKECVWCLEKHEILKDNVCNRCYRVLLENWWKKISTIKKPTD